MAHIVIKDLPESVELDQKAMTAVVGGGTRFRFNPQQSQPSSISERLGFNLTNSLAARRAFASGRKA
ncbi:hypothetical protein Nhal_0825 [Nitrosococcus halophilus Nc 4]|uniref:Uncharacterized protein n=1 Tax=Nitrosococcus halophilus (strain Nc4) TaxID=472759 RepID=D5BXP3_NITHN|nr:hypothetical protein [Nitrosococcus halophilus]ADE14001.1 hypothetical protein Nhal_0825 [Nitrosococcus halophilus Nc 4]